MEPADERYQTKLACMKTTFQAAQNDTGQKDNQMLLSTTQIGYLIK